jgi:hypothetical protein
MNTYYENIELQTEEVLETSPVASAILKFMESGEEWNGNATEFQLDQIAGEKATKNKYWRGSSPGSTRIYYREKATKNKYWPRTASVLIRRINEVKTNLQEVGAGQQDPVTRVKTIVITKPSIIGKRV